MLNNVITMSLLKKNKKQNKTKQNKKTKKSNYANLNEKDIVDNKQFWRTVKP